MSLPIRHRPSPNFGVRRGRTVADMVILHYTGMKSAGAAIERLCDPTAHVSSHYLIDQEGTVVAMVAEDARAWHAGASVWNGDTDINSRSIGIELVNPGHTHGYADFPALQMTALLRLLEAIHTRHRIPAGHLLAHSDIAPDRKQDPGEKFDWRLLADAGFGLWVPPAPSAPGPTLATGDRGAGVALMQVQLSALGYGLEATGTFDERTRQVVTAFQRHWRQAVVDGRADVSTRATLGRLAAAIRSG